ncbi:MAG: hypothetical protein JNM21_08045 [Taibaiella sp.]|nr:hypothetical protein [Taibaiella sp.]
MLYNKYWVKTTARVILFSLTFQLLSPLVASALTSGPTQPEVASFEPVGTTDMVDLFTGDFVYNIPLLDIEGYPINISYHSGGDMDQEASWVGYGWNINPGVINRHVRGLPDDFNGETISRQINIKPEKNTRVGIDAAAEWIGVGKPPGVFNLSFGSALNFSNYRGVSADINLSIQAGLSITPKNMPGVNIRGTGGISLGAGSQSGADVDANYNLGLNFKTSQTLNQDMAMSAGWSQGTGYNTRYGLKGKNEGVSVGVGLGGRSNTGPSYNKRVPIAMRNYVPIITNASQLKTYRGHIKVGAETPGWIFWQGGFYGQMSKLEYEKSGDRPGYGYFYAQNANVDALQDFTRDKDGMFNESMGFLPLGNMTYDVYSVSGQGTGGSFRPFRNDYGTVYDPVVSPPENKEFQIAAEAGFSGLFELGADGHTSRTNTTSGPWDEYQRPFTKNKAGSVYENVFFKQAGELTLTDPEFYASIGHFGPISGAATKNIPLKKANAEKKRDPRANLISYFTAAEAEKFGVASSRALYSYQSNGFANGADAPKDSIARIGGARKAYHLSEIVQTQTDGRRYVYGIAAMNTQQHEYTFAVNGSPDADGLVTIGNGENTASNESGTDHFFTKTSTPAFAHSYLLTSVLSTDYVDVTGNGPSDDDLGTFTKFNYSRKEANYKWRAPYESNKAQFNEGAKSDSKDNKGNYLEGMREQWLLHSVESKNYVAEFYTSARNDAKGADNMGSSYKLDSIKLYNKHERFVSPATAVPVKTVIFDYDYSLCPGVPNAGGGGKLTLKKIYIRYGNSDKSMISPYQFQYDNNYPYAFGNKDRWGMYKPNGSPSNVDFPFVNQTDTSIHKYAAAWSLNRIKLPSGGTINIKYEADDYSFVQNKEATEMFILKGIGNSENYNPGSQLYINKNTPNNYFYFKRDATRENPNISFKDNYLKNEKILYYNVSTELTKNKTKEPIKGYAEVEAVGICANDNAYGFVKVKPVTPVKGGALLNPATYTAINYGRYYLPHIIFPGSDPDKDGIANIISGIIYSLGELIQFSKNPVKRMVEEGKAKNVELASSYIRLNSPGLKKKGGGQRVAELSFSDSWSKLAGGNNTDAAYGKRYHYTIDAGNGFQISSGVASYEPLVGGDENPFRMPEAYTAQNGGNWPPHDPVGLYQELPLGESLYPGAVVGYSKVTVESLHKDHAKSAQGVDIHEFYTAKEFPIKVESLPKQVLETEETYGFKKQKVVYRAAQGFALRFNDMHGKPKRNEHRVAKPGSSTSELISYTQYNYNRNGSELNNEVPVMAYDPASQKMKRMTKLLGVESDLTIDTREKTERTKTNTWQANLNVAYVGPWPIPIPLPYWWKGKYENDFSSVVATKVIQQYGILMEVETFQEGALTTLRNEAFDPVTGQAIITSVNNEYKDREYSVNYPAYWGYKAMGGSYENTAFEATFASLEIDNYQAVIPSTSALPLKVGDELYITYEQQGLKENNVWVMEQSYHQPEDLFPCKCINKVHNDSLSNYPPPYSYFTDANIVDTVELPPRDYWFIGSNLAPLGSDGFNYVYQNCSESRIVLAPRFKYSFPATGVINNVKIKVVRSGAKNMLTESIQNYTGQETPFDANNLLKEELSKLITITAKEYSDRQNAILPKYDSLINPAGYDSLNSYVNGTISVMRLVKEYAYIKDRNYSSATNRDKGLFKARSLWSFTNNSEGCLPVDVYCMSQHPDFGDEAYIPTLPSPDVYVLHFSGYQNPANGVSSKYNLFSPNTLDPNWVVARTVTKWSPWGMELENKDATGNYTAAQYGYNEQLPTALAQNAKQHQILFEGFEDYQLLQAKNNLLEHFINPFKNLFATSGLSQLYKLFNTTGVNGLKLSKVAAHTGNYALETGNSNHTLNFNITNANIDQGTPRYLPFSFTYGKSYLVSFWYRPVSPVANATVYGTPLPGFIAKSDIIEGWQQFEGRITMTNSTSITQYDLALPKGAFIDDIRIMPIEANMKSFVYNPVNQKLMATLDENNFASFFEYDQEGNLVRTKKETEKGIMTISESRSANPQTTKPGF